MLERQIKSTLEHAKALYDPRNAFGNEKIIKLLALAQELHTEVETTDECLDCEGFGERYCGACDNDSECRMCGGSGRVPKT